jgi:hypothetical protein
VSLPVFFPACDVVAVLPPGERLTLRALCERAGLACRVSGPPARRRVRLADGPALRALRKPGPLSDVWLAVPRGDPKKRALQALGLLAYGVLDYGARETLRGLPIACPSPGPGRPASGRALSSAERQRRHRMRLRRQPA